MKSTHPLAIHSFISSVQHMYIGQLGKNSGELSLSLQYLQHSMQSIRASCSGVPSSEPSVLLDIPQHSILYFVNVVPVLRIFHTYCEINSSTYNVNGNLEA